MCVEHRTISLGFTGEEMHEGMHICYVYDDEAERDDVISRFLEAGLLANEKVLCLVNDVSEPGRVGKLAEPRPGSLNIADAAKSYCPSGTFTPDDMLDLIRDFYLQAVDAEQYAGARGAGQMEWSLDDALATEEQLISYEVKLNSVLARHPLTVICQYDARRYSGRTIMDILSTHPAVIIRGKVVKNPYFTDPEALLRKYRARAGNGLADA